MIETRGMREKVEARGVLGNAVKGFLLPGSPYSSLPRSGCIPRVHGDHGAAVVAVHLGYDSPQDLYAEGVPQEGACRRILLDNAFGVTDEL
jgi:hypothetical protein